jgi:hypothetical protein
MARTGSASKELMLDGKSDVRNGPILIAVSHLVLIVRRLQDGWNPLKPLRCVPMTIGDQRIIHVEAMIQRNHVKRQSAQQKCESTEKISTWQLPLHIVTNQVLRKMEAECLACQIRSIPQTKVVSLDTNPIPSSEVNGKLLFPPKATQHNKNTFLIMYTREIKKLSTKKCHHPLSLEDTEYPQWCSRCRTCLEHHTPRHVFDSGVFDSTSMLN